VPTATATAPASPGRAALVAVGFLLATVLARVTVECGGGLAIGAWAVADGADLTDPDAMATAFESLPIALIAALTILQLTLLGALAVGFAFLLRPARETLALRVGAWGVWPFAILGGLVVGTGPGWLAEWLTRWLPSWLQLGALDQIAAWFQQGDLGGKLLLGVAVVLFAPLCEELVFRGLLWGAIRRFAPEAVAWLATSGLFALYHLDPIHVITVLPIGLFIGWIRWTSGSLWAAVAVHFVNNALAAVLAAAAPPDLSIPWWIALPCFALTLLFAAPAWFVRRRPAPVES
jgi:membrane protease YdiL (CAAX protease family)